MLARESTVRERQLDHQLTDLRARVASIGGTVDREISENAVSAFKRQRVELPDGTFGYRVVRPEWEKILTALRRGECNALMVPDIDRAIRDPRTPEDLIDAVELYGLYVASLTGNFFLRFVVAASPPPRSRRTCTLRACLTCSSHRLCTRVDVQTRARGVRRDDQ